MSGEQFFELFTRPNPKPGPGDKESDPKDSLKELAPITPEFFTDFLLGLEFGSFEKQHNFIWKYGHPWRYPANEFEMLKTAVRVMSVAEIQKAKEARNAKTDVAQALGIGETTKEKNRATAKSMAAFFKELPA